MGLLLLQGCTDVERHESTWRVADAIQSAGACLTDTHQYSNVALQLRIEADATAMGALADKLRGAGVHLDQDSIAALEEASRQSGELQLSLHLRFYCPEPDLRIPTAAAPGGVIH